MSSSLNPHEQSFSEVPLHVHFPASGLSGCRVWYPSHNHLSGVSEARLLEAAASEPINANRGKEMYGFLPPMQDESLSPRFPICSQKVKDADHGRFP